MKKAIRQWVHPAFADFLNTKSHQLGVSKIKLTERMVEEGVIDDEVYNKKLWGIFYKPKR